MAKHVVKSNVLHDGQSFPKGVVVKEDHKHFHALKENGHLEMVVEKEAVAADDGEKAKNDKKK